MNMFWGQTVSGWQQYQQLNDETIFDDGTWFDERKK